MRYVGFILSFMVLGALPVGAENAPSAVKATPPETLACKIFRKRGDWYAQARRTEVRWGVPAAHQFALLTEEWPRDEDKLPASWRPRFTLPDRGTPGLPDGHFDATWKQYKAESGSKRANPEDFGDLSDFMGWYFYRTAARTGLSPYDAAGQYIVWRQGPNMYASQSWKQNLWISQQANRFAERTRAYNADLDRCTNELDESFIKKLTKLIGTRRPWRVGKPGQKGLASSVSR